MRSYRDCTNDYDARFYDAIEPGTIASARVVVPIVLRLVTPRSVLDVGCGRAAWLRVWQECGVADVFGIDGDYVDRSRLLIDRSRFASVDLSAAVELDRTADLVQCLEVAEHLPPSCAGRLVQMLTEAAPVVLFSAALPGQGGTRHVNEQWPMYWRRRFAGHGFVEVDAIRRHVFQDNRVEWWYQQNIRLFASRDAVRASAALQEEMARTENSQMEAVSSIVLSQFTSFRSLLKQTARAGWRSIRARLLRKTR